MNIFRLLKNPIEIKQHFNDPLFRNSYFLMGNVFLFSIIGFLFWIIAARLYSSAEIGIGSAIISTTSFFSIFSLMGFDISLIRYLPNERNKMSMINSCFLMSAVISTLISMVFILGSSIWSPTLVILKDNVFLGLLFVFFTIFASLSTLQISVYVAFRESKYSFYQSIINISRVILLPLLTVFGVFGLYSSFGITYILTFIWGNKYIKKIFYSYKFNIKINGQIIKKMFFYSLWNYVANILTYFPNYILPLLLLNLLGATFTGYFYIAWTLSSVLLIIPGAVSKSLLAEGSFSSEKNKENILKSLKFTFIILTISIILIFIFGRYFLLLFGTDYAIYSVDLLNILALASIPHSVVVLYASIKRIEKKVLPVILNFGVIAFITIFLGLFFVTIYGLIGIGYSWFLGNFVSMILIGVSILINRLNLLKN